MYIMGSSPTRGSSFFLGKVTALGVLCCFALVCLTLFASFFLLICHKNMHIYICIEENNVYEYMNKCLKESLAFRISCIREESQNSEGK